MRSSRQTLCVGWMLGLLLTVCSVSAELRFPTGIKQCNNWQSVYNQMPAVWKTDRIIDISLSSEKRLRQLMDEGEGEREIGGDQVVEGGFWEGSDQPDADATIVVLNSLKGERGEHTFAHEYGHFVWDFKLTAGQQKIYQGIWEHQKTAGHLISSYAGTSVEEGFAEAFSAYLCERDKLHNHDLLSENFLSALAKGEKEEKP